MDIEITPQIARKLLEVCRGTTEMIEAEKAKALLPGQPAYRGGCKHHPDAVFLLRATKNGAHEDAISHTRNPGSHHLTVTPESWSATNV